MAVEIQVLSGSLQGRCLRFDGDRISIGDSEQADVCFRPNQEPGSRAKTAVLTFDDEDGWRLSNEGAGTWLVNQTPVAAGFSHRLRSDDLVRVSEMGPEFYFRLVARLHGAALPATVSTEAVAATAAKPHAAAATQSAISAQPRVEPAPLSLPGATVQFEHRDAIERVMPDNDADPLLLAHAPADDVRKPVAAQAASDQTRAAADVAAAAKITAVAAAGKEAAAAVAVKPRRRRRESSTWSRVLGTVVSGLLGLACAYGLACWIGGARNDVFHIFHR